MIIRRLVIENFKIFHGIQELVFEGEEAQDRHHSQVFLITGANGHGKSTIMDAITFALYGKEWRSEGFYVSEPSELINQYAMQNHEWRCSVTLEFDHFGDRYHVMRRLEMKRTGTEEAAGNPETPAPDEALVEEQSASVNGQAITTVHPITTVVSAILPEHVAKFYFFDGETITRFADEYSENRTAVETVLGIPNIKRGVEELERVIYGYRRRLASLDTAHEVRETRRRLEEHRYELRKIQREVVNEQQLLKEFEAMCAAVQKELNLLNNYLGLTTTRETLEAEMKGVVSEREALARQQRSFIDRGAYYLLRPRALKAIETIQHRKERSVELRIKQGRLNAQEELLRAILKTKSCICGTPLSTSQYGKVRISDLLHELEEEERHLEHYETDTFGQTRSDIAAAYEYLPSPKRFEEELEGLNSRSADLAQREKGLSEELAAVKNRLAAEYSAIASIPGNRARIKGPTGEKEDRLTLTDAPSLQDETERVARKLTQLNIDQAVHRARIDALERERGISQRNVEQLEDALVRCQKAHQAMSVELLGAIVVAKRVQQTLTEVIDQSAAVKRREIQHLASKIFKDITNKPEEYQHLEIDPETYEVSVIGTDNEFIETSRLSDGERHVVALSFLSGLKDSAVPGALVIDSPFGRLDSIHKIRLLRKLPRLARQVVLFVTDEDLTSEEIAALTGVAGQWGLEHDQATKTSSITPIPA